MPSGGLAQSCGEGAFPIEIGQIGWCARALGGLPLCLAKPKRSRHLVFA